MHVAAVVCCSEAAGRAILERFDWSLEAAVDAYFQGGMVAAPRGDASKIDALFDNYKGQDVALARSE